MRIKSIKFIDDFKMFPKGTEYSFGEKLNVIKGKGGAGKTIMSEILFRLAAGNKLSFVEVGYYYNANKIRTEEGYSDFLAIIDDFGVINEVTADLMSSIKRYSNLLSRQVIVCIRTHWSSKPLVVEEEEDTNCITMPEMP